MNILDKLKKLQDETVKTQDYTELEKMYASTEYKQLSYLERNRGLVTSHKLKDFMRCQHCFALKYVMELPNPIEGEMNQEALTVGQALDDLLTEGKEYYADKYETVARRSKEAEKVQLTNTMSKQIDQMAKEFVLAPAFNPTPHKKILLVKYGELILKIEMDDFIPERCLILDAKSAANITTFNPSYYAFQMAFYAYVVEIALDIKCHALLEVVDKFGPFSRSGAWWFDHTLLREQRGAIVAALDELQQSMDTGIFMPATEQEVLWGCPYYGLEGHGRSIKPIIV